MIVLWHCSTYYLVEHSPQYRAYRDDKIACYKAFIIITMVIGITLDHWERMRCCQFVLIVWYKINKHLKMVWMRCVCVCVCARACACVCVLACVCACACMCMCMYVHVCYYVCDCIVDTVSDYAINSVYGIDKVVCVQLTTYSMTNSWKDSYRSWIAGHLWLA